MHNTNAVASWACVMKPEGGGWFCRKPPRMPKHVCLPPDISSYRGGDEWIKDWAWRCECGKFFTVRETDMFAGMFAPLWEWVEAWPWQRGKLRRRWESEQEQER